MARCGCSGSCGCYLADGENTTVSGAGTEANPYVVNAEAGGGGAGTVTSVNGDTGPAVDLDLGDIAETATAKKMTDVERTKLSGIAAGADATVQATESVAGKAEIATQAEADAEADDTRIITPLKLGVRLADFLTAVDVANVIRAVDLARTPLPNKTVIWSATNPAPMTNDEAWAVPGDSVVLAAAAPFNQFKTPVNYLAFPQNIIGTGASVLTSGRAQYTPIVLQPGTYDALAINVFVAQVGGTATFTAALYDEASDGFPDTAGGQLLSTTHVMTATGDVIVSDAPPLVVTTPTRYWFGSLYYASSAPSTAPQLICISSQSQAFPAATVITPSAGDGWIRGSGLTSLPSDASTTANVTITAANNVPYFGVRRSA